MTTSAVQNTIFRGLYNPKGWPELAEELAEVERGEGRRMWEKLAAGDLGLGSKDPTENVFNRSMDVTGSGLLCHVSSSPRLREKRLTRAVDHVL